MADTVTTFVVDVRVIVAELAPRLFIASASVAGMTIRGGTRESATEALASFFAVLSSTSGNTDDSKIAIALLIANTSLPEISQQISAQTVNRKGNRNG